MLRYGKNGGGRVAHKIFCTLLCTFDEIFVKQFILKFYFQVNLARNSTEKWANTSCWEQILPPKMPHKIAHFLRKHSRSVIPDLCIATQPATIGGG